jgi:hypothetical protein
LNILILNASDIVGGAARAAFRLHKGLQSIGVGSKMLVQSKYGDDNNVIGPDSKFSKGCALLKPALDNLPLAFYPNREKNVFSSAIVPDRLPSKLGALNPDIIHLHWVAGGFLRIETLRRLKRPLIHGPLPVVVMFLLTVKDILTHVVFALH